MMNKRKMLLLFGCLALLPHLALAEPWTLGRTVESAKNASNAIALYRLDAETASVNIVEASASWRPSLSFSSEAKVISHVMELSLPFKTVRFGDYDSYGLRLSVGQKLYDAGASSLAKKASGHFADYSEYSAEAARLSVEYRAKQAFFSLLMNDQGIEVSEATLEEAERHLRIATVRYNEGLLLENDLMKARLRVSEAEMHCTKSRAARDYSAAQFREITGLDQDSEITLTFDSFGGGSNLALSRPDIETRPEMKAFQAALAQNEETEALASVRTKPQVNLVAGVDYGQPGIDLPSNEWMHYFSAGIVLNWNILDRGEVSASRQRLAIARKKIGRSQDDFTRQLMRQAAEAFTSLETNLAQRDLAEKSLGFARSSLELTKTAFTEGTATETDYDNAFTEQTKYEHLLVESNINIELSKARIEYVMGVYHNGGRE